MLSMLNAPYVIGSYVVTFGGIALYTWAVLARARKAARGLPEDELPWK